MYLVKSEHKYSVYFQFSHTACTQCFPISLCRSGLWSRHPKIHPDGTRAALWHGADRGPVQVHLPVCVPVHTDHQGQRPGLHGERQGQKIQREDEGIGLFLWLKYTLIQGRPVQERTAEIYMSIGLCTFGCWLEHYNRLVQCQQNDMLSESGLWKMNIDPETENNQPQD